MSRENFLGLAARFVQARYGNPSTLRYHRETWWTWSDGHYRTMTESDLRGIIKQWLGEESENTKDLYVKEVRSAVASLPNVNISDSLDMPLYIELDHYDNTCNFLALKNRILDLDVEVKEGVRGIVRQPTPNWFSPVVLAYNYDPEAQCPLFRAFLSQVLPDGPSQDVMQEWFGYCLTKDTDMKTLMILLGEGRTGKSTLTNILEALIGPENRSAVALEDLGGKYAPHQTLGKLVNFCGDAKQIESLAEGVIKTFTGGDTMTIDEKYKRIYAAKMTAKIMACTNIFPKITDISDAMWDRFIVVPMNQRIPKDKVDLQLLNSENHNWPLRKELPGIFNWAIEGLKRLRKQGGFTVSKKFLQTKARTRRDNCSLTLFVEERCSPERSTPVKRFMHEYQCFCEGMGLEALGSVQVGVLLRKLIPELEKTKLGPRGCQQSHYVGVAVHVPRDD